MKQLSLRTLTAYYATALIIIAMLSIASHLILDHAMQTKEGDARIVNISGRQRMLSQRIVSMAAQYRLGDPAARLDLIAAIDEFEAAHRMLLNAKAEKNEATQELHRLYYDGSDGLDAMVGRFVANARFVAAASPDEPAAGATLQTLFVEARAPILQALDTVVTIHQFESERRLSRLQTLQWAILLVVLLTLLLEVVTIFRPINRRIMRYTNEILLLATTDPLTNTANRRSFLERSAIELARADRQGHPLSLLILDVDHFKVVNDTHGHGAGDEVLRVLAATLRSGLRQTDILGRIGGEEFAVLLLDMTPSQAADLAERLRTQVAATGVPYREHRITVTISIGVAPVVQETGGIEHALTIADGLLYEAKRAGRNRVAVTLVPA